MTRLEDDQNRLWSAFGSQRACSFGSADRVTNRR